MQNYGPEEALRTFSAFLSDVHFMEKNSMNAVSKLSLNGLYPLNIHFIILEIWALGASLNAAS